MTELAGNLRRLLACRGMTLAELAEASKLDERTIRSLLAGRSARPHARTLFRLAEGLGVAVGELFRNPALEARRQFDRGTNPVIEEIVEEHPQLLADWCAAELEELYSHFGDGGSLTREGALATVAAINRKRAIQAKVALLLETGEADVLVGVIDVLYRRVVVTPA